jgi:serine/threonine-protein kinase RsbW
VPAERRGLERSAEWVAELGREARLTPSLAFRVELCLGEALANIVEHGFEGGQSGQIGLSFRADDEGLELVVVDDGSPFDPMSLPARASPRRLEDAEPGGLGVPLMRRFADSCSYERRASQNRLTLTWRRGAAGRNRGDAP